MTESDVGPDELEARALWHAELDSARRWKAGADLDDDCDDDEGGYLGDIACWNCEDGIVVICIDDLCRGAGECMHGADGMAICRECRGGRHR